MSLPADRGLFAVKGRASATGARLPADIGDALAETTTAQPALTETGGGAEKKAATDQPGSLLAFRLRSAPGKSALTGEIVTALSRPATPKPAVAPAAPSMPEAVSAPPAAEAIPVPSAPLPAVSETPGGRIDQPAFPQPLLQRRDVSGERGPAKVYVPPAPVIAIPPRPSTLRTVLPAAAAVAAIAVVGWLIAQSEPSAPEAPAPVAEHIPAPAPLAADNDAAQPIAAAAASAEVQPALETPAAPPAAAAETGATAEPDKAEAAALVAPAPDPAVADQAAAELTAGPAQMDTPVPAPLPPVIPIDAPSFEVVRAEPGAAPVLAGRAAPGSQLLVLDNGTLIGTATADLNGEWALVGEAPLSPGRHELSLALKTPEGSLVVEQADAEMAPGSASAAGLPIPAEKPTPGAAERSYVVQLASVPSSADATREWARLQQAYPALLGQREATIDAAEIGGRGTFYRIRTGPFSERESARSLCRELNGAGQECLVVRGAGGS